MCDIYQSFVFILPLIPNTVNYAFFLVQLNFIFFFPFQKECVFRKLSLPTHVIQLWVRVYYSSIDLFCLALRFLLTPLGLVGWLSVSTPSEEYINIRLNLKLPTRDKAIPTHNSSDCSSIFKHLQWMNASWSLLQSSS